MGRQPGRKAGDTVETDKRGCLTSTSLSVLNMWRDILCQDHLLSDACALWLMRLLLAYDLITILACSLKRSKLPGTWGIRTEDAFRNVMSRNLFLAPVTLIHPKNNSWGPTRSWKGRNGHEGRGDLCHCKERSFWGHWMDFIVWDVSTGLRFFGVGRSSSLVSSGVS